MDAFDRYCRAYCREVEHPFGSGRSLEFSEADLRVAIATVRGILTAPVAEPRLANLSDRFTDAFHRYLTVPRDQPGSLVNAVERLTQLAEPFLKKLVLLSYPTRLSPPGPSGTPLWHLGLERILTDLGLLSADLKRKEPDYWRRRPASDAFWRLVFVTRHKGAHEAHRYDPAFIERVVLAFAACLLLSAHHTLNDAGSRVREQSDLAEALRFQELLRARAQTYPMTADLPRPSEHIRLFLHRRIISLDSEEARLVFASWCAGRGPAFFFLRDRDPNELRAWAYEFLSSADTALARGAAAFLLATSQSLPLSRVLELFSHFNDRFRLAAAISRIASRQDLSRLWTLHQGRRSRILGETAIEALASLLTPRDSSWLRRADASASPASFDVYCRAALRLARPESLNHYRRAARQAAGELRHRAITSLGRIGTAEDLNLLERIVLRTRRDKRTRVLCFVALAMIAARHRQWRTLRNLIAKDHGAIAELALFGLSLAGIRAPTSLIRRAFRRRRLECAEALYHTATSRDRGLLRKLLLHTPPGDAAHYLVLAIARVGAAKDLHFLLRLFGRYRQEAHWMDRLEIVRAVSALPIGSKEAERFIRRCLTSPEFWKYFGRDRPTTRMPLATHENVPFMRQLAAFCFARLARPVDRPRLRRMVRNDYWALYRAGTLGLLRIDGEQELDTLLGDARMSEDVPDGVVEALVGLDLALFCPIPDLLEGFTKLGRSASE